MCIVWDWNGTLLDDNQASLDALNKILARRSLPQISLEYYRKHFAFPVADFYEHLGVKILEEDWNALAQEYHDAYHEGILQLSRDAKDAILQARALGFKQAVVYAMREDYLLADMDKFAIRNFFEAVLGTDNLDGCSKLERMNDFVAKANESKFVLIGDSLHDYEAACSVGAKCIVYGGGSHHQSRLEHLAPVATTLCDAVRLAHEIAF